MSPAPRRLVLLVVGLLGLGLYFRFAHLDRKLYWNDEAFTVLWISGHSGADLGQTLRDGPVRFEALQRFKHVDCSAGALGVIRTLTKAEPHQVPGYALLAWDWACLVGDSVSALRALSAVVSVLALGLTFWLCRELFEAPQVAWLAAGLQAVSPFHVIYAQEARDYSLWIVIVLLSSAALLRALRRQTPLAWAAYAVTLTAGLYTHLFFGFAIAAHTVYVLAGSHEPRAPTWRAYALASAAGVLPFLPWLVRLWHGRAAVLAQTGWTVNPSDLMPWLKTVLLNVTCVVFDARMRDDNALYVLTIPIAIAMAAAGWSLLRHTPRRVWLFVAALMLTTPIALGLPDLLFGGRRFIVFRYGVVLYIGIELALAHWLARHLERANRWRSWWWWTVTAALLFGGIVSDLQFVRADTWWHKSISRSYREIAAVLRTAERPLVVSESGGAVLTLSYAIPSGVSARVVTNGRLERVPAGFGEVFALCPSDTLLRSLTALGPWTPVVSRQTCENTELWRLTRRSD